MLAGTSRGGICTMALALANRDRIAGALINDIGPEIDRAGVERIAGWVGKDVRFANWDEAIDKIMARNGDIYPDYGRTEWERFVRRTLRQDGAAIVFDYDMAIAGNFDSAASAPDLWPL